MSARTPAELAKSIALAMAHGQTIFMVCDCEISYEGRARSRLGRGERMIILKEDGTVIVHQKHGREPVNWMPPRTKTELVETNGALRLVSTKQRDRERMEVDIFSVKGFQSFHLEDFCRLDVYGTEKDFVRELIKDPSIIEKGFRLSRNERLTLAGSIDISGLDSEGRPVVVEVKRSKATPHDVVQLKRYVDSVRKKTSQPVRGILVCPSSSSKARRLLVEYGLEMRRVDPLRLERGRGRADLTRFVSY